ncbi:MAG TPA: hypothetical protein VII68_13825 [Casimicrobiaceae bacterium]|jgi:hypothetical protein
MDAVSLLDLIATAWRVVDSAFMGVALVILATILAAVGGAVSWKMRLYGAMVGGMLVNAVAKAEGAGYEAALAAMMTVTALAFALGNLGRLVDLKLIKRP